MPPRYELLYINSHSLLVVTPKGVLKRLYCPFPARCQQQVGLLKAGTFVAVEGVKSLSGDTSRLVFFIEGKAYLHSHFSIEIVL